jgi:hypothetical protein
MEVGAGQQLVNGVVASELWWPCHAALLCDVCLTHPGPVFATAHSDVVHTHATYTNAA